MLTEKSFNYSNLASMKKINGNVVNNLREGFSVGFFFNQHDSGDPLTKIYWPRQGHLDFTFLLYYLKKSTLKKKNRYKMSKISNLTLPHHAGN